MLYSSVLKRGKKILLYDLEKLEFIVTARMLKSYFLSDMNFSKGESFFDVIPNCTFK